MARLLLFPLLLLCALSMACGVDEELYQAALLEAETLRSQLAVETQRADGAEATLAAESARLQREIDELVGQLEERAGQVERLTGENRALAGELDALGSELAGLEAAHSVLESDHLALGVELQDARDDIASEQRRNQELTEQFDALALEHQAAVASNATLTTSLSETQTELAQASEALDSATIELEVANSLYEALTEEHVLAIKARDALSTENADLISAKASLETAVLELAVKYDGLVADIGAIETLGKRKSTLAGEVVVLDSQVVSLRQDIAQLEERRRPLVVQSYRNSFRCTGSMEPKITCLDEALWLSNFKAEDITLGAIVSFYPTSDCSITSGPVAHRVVDIRWLGGAYSFRTRGDAADEDDGCWLPSSSINSYLIDLYKNVRPEYAELRNAVNAARADLDAKEADYLQKLQTYQQKRLQYCGSLTGTCTLSTPRYNEMQSLYQALEAAYNAYSVAYFNYQALIAVAKG
ncbi:MAG: hypothetical protein FJ319_06525 [SAR202 cluster bacterium]|nr:hypothetical protein [SAR202 cluster bacterium]